MSELVAHRRHPAADEDAARRRPAARRLPHGHRQDAGARTSRRVQPYPTGQDIVRPLDDPDQAGQPPRRALRQPRARGRGGEDHRQGRPALRRAAPACSTARRRRCRRSSTARSKKGDVIVIRYEGPKGGPGMREMLSPTSAIMGTRPRQRRRAHHRRPFLAAAATASSSATSRRRPRSAARSPRARRRPDHHRRDAGEINLDVGEPELAARRAAWQPRTPYATRGVLAKYAELVSSASLGAVTDRGLKVAGGEWWFRWLLQKIEMHDCYCLAIGAWVKFAAADRIGEAV